MLGGGERVEIGEGRGTGWRDWEEGLGGGIKRIRGRNGEREWGEGMG